MKRTAQESLLRRILASVSSIWSWKKVRLGRSGQRIVARQVSDLRLGAAALGDVLDQHDRAAVLHRLEGERQSPSIFALDLKTGVLIAREAARDLGGKAIGAGARERSDPDTFEQKFADGGAAANDLGRDAQEFGEAPVGYDQTLLGVEHAQAERHVVERRVEAAGKQRDVARRDHGIHQSLSQTIGDEF